jgi:hypothetical protein
LGPVKCREFLDSLSDCFLYLFKKALTVLRGPLAHPNGLLDLHIETFCRTSWPGDQPDARHLPTQDNTTQKHMDTHPCPKQGVTVSFSKRTLLHEVGYN